MEEAPPRSVRFLDAEFGFATSGDAPYAVMRTLDAGRSWAYFAAPGSSIIPVTRSLVFLQTSDELLRSVDGGRNWERVGVSPRLSPLFLSETFGWALAESRVLVTDDAGGSWRDVSPPSGQVWAAAFFLNQNTGWAAQHDKLARTVDGGRSWSTFELSSPLLGEPSPFSLQFVDEKIGYAGGYGLWRTEDGGVSWAFDGRGVGGTQGKVALHMFGAEHGWAVERQRVFRRAPGLALTPTPIQTATPSATPVPTVTPAPICSWTGQWQTVSNGEPFSMTLTESGGLPGQRSVRGGYGPDDRRIEAMAEGGTLTGRWSGPPTYAEPAHAGRFRFTMSSDCASFSGTWGFGAAEAGGGGWSGTLVSADPGRAAMVTAAYRATLCRDPEASALAYWVASGASQAALDAQLRASGEYGALQPARNAYLSTLARDPVLGDCPGLRYWAGTGLSQAGIETHLAASDEGQRVRAIRDLYLELLGRDPLGPDTAALRHWVVCACSVDQIRQAILASDEYRNRTR